MQILSGHGTTLRLLAGAVLLAPGHERAALPMRNLEIRGAFVGADQRVEAALQAWVATPFGRVPITGRAHVDVACNYTFTGTIGYSGIVRVLAHLKGIGLVTYLRGDVKSDRPLGCDLMRSAADSMRGQVRSESSMLTGWIIFGGDSARFSGPTRTIGDTAYHTRLTLRRGGRRHVVQLWMFERPQRESQQK
jgi:hypothetical protein